MKDFAFLATLVALCLSLSSAISPAKDARTYFSGDFFRRNIEDLNKTKSDFIISPVSTQKFLVALYEGMKQNTADRLLFDIGVKHIDYDRFGGEVFAETGSYDTCCSGHLLDKQERELAELVSKSEVLNFFENDFKNTSNSINVQNYIVVPADLNPKPEYQKFAKEYFNIDLVHAKTDVDQNLKQKFGVEANDDYKVALYSNLELNLTLVNSFVSGDDRFLMYDGQAKYYEDDWCQYAELNLENGLKLFIAIGKAANKFNTYITNDIGRQVNDFERFYANKWRLERVKAIIPIVDLENVYDLTITFRKIADRGLKHALTFDAALSEVFENWPERGLNLQHFWQRVALKIKPSAARILSFGGPKFEFKLFSAVDKNFFYLIKGDTSYYAMGTYIGEKTEN